MRSFSPLTATLSAAFTSTMALGLAAAPATAAPAPAPQVSENNRHCVLRLTSGGGMSCYGTFTGVAPRSGPAASNAARAPITYAES